MTRKTAIIGAGMAGLTCARALHDAGRSVVLFDKGRGPGGRMASRRVETDKGMLRFDHGAQFFTAESPEFAEQVRHWTQGGAAARWDAASDAADDDLYVGTPAMNEVVRAQAVGLDVRWGARAERIERDGDGWQVVVDGEGAAFDAVVVAVPAEQAAELLQEAAPEFAQVAGSSQSDPCWALMAAFAQRLPIDADTHRSGDDARIAWAARDGAKPGRSGGESWVVHASAGYSLRHLELDREEMANLMVAAFFEELGAAPVVPEYATAHRWRYAKADPVDGPGYLLDADAGIGVCGDWLVAPKVEGAFRSGLSLGRAMAGGA
ncbi:FAD-dependent oxidoreductase [Qipengyuania sp. JC766]|uniref:NAD(P)/FAD-dependent oxidoreductase n=1 Tax=Qipengyuania sp. JC766 TaxID=3232139 RepID=UPI0034598B72